MKIIKSILILTFFILITYNSYATIYYVSNSGNDSNNGISPDYPLKSVLKINQIISKMIPGDIILLERGSIFYGQINISSSGDENSPIIIASYGEGKNPVISASVPITEWSIYKGNIYSSNVNGIVKNIYVNGKQMFLARYPNSGFLTIDNPFSNPKTGFTDKQLSQSAGYWNGSIVRIRTINWAYEYSEVKKFENFSLFLDIPTTYPTLSGWGYYLDNNLNELDTINEWYYQNNETGSGKVFYYPDIGEDINELDVQASIQDYGISSDMHLRNIVIRELEILNQSETGIYFSRKVSELRIENCTFRGQIKTGISIDKKSDNVKIINCRFNDINGRALSLNNVSHSSVSRNIFLNSGMIPGYGTTGDAYVLSAVHVFGDTNIVSENYINGVGHDAINCIGTGNLVEKNVIKNCLMFLNDGGGIKCYGKYSSNSVWCNNFISNIKGNYENTTREESVALGIYLDEFTNNMSILNNTVTGSGFSGIGIHDADNNLIADNVLYNNRAGLNFFQNIHSKDNRIFSNVVKSNYANQYSVDVRYLGGELLPGKFDSNFYFTPDNYRSFGIRYRNVFNDYSFEDWKLFIKSDSQSKIYIGPEVNFSKLLTNMSDEIISVDLESQFNYKDIYLRNINGSVEIQPWTSEIIFTKVDFSKKPEITIARGTLYFDEIGDENSSLNWYVMSGVNISEPVYVTAPEGFEISLFNDHDFGNKIIINSENGTVENIVYVRYNTVSTGKVNGSIINISGGLMSVVKILSR